MEIDKNSSRTSQRLAASETEDKAKKVEEKKTEQPSRTPKRPPGQSGDSGDSKKE